MAQRQDQYLVDPKAWTPPPPKKGTKKQTNNGLRLVYD